MKILVRLLQWLAVVVLGFWLWSLIFPSPEKVIRKHLEKTARTASIRAEETPFQRIGNIRAFADCFSETVEVRFETPGGGRQELSGREEIMRVAGLVRGMGGNLQVDFLDVSVALAPDKQSATVNLVARAKIAGDGEFFVQEMKILLKKFGRSWLIVRAETVKTLTARNVSPSAF